MQIIYFGAPGNGFESHPKDLVNSVAAFDKSHLEYGEIDCKYIKKRDFVDIIYVIYGLGGKGDASYRKGRNFGVCIRLQGNEIKESDRLKLYDFLKKFIHEGVNQEAVGLFTPNNGRIVDFRVKSLQNSAKKLEKLSLTLKEQFNQQFGNSLREIRDTKSYSQDLIPNQSKKDSRVLRQSNEIIELVKNDVDIKKTPKASLNWFLLLFIPFLFLFSTYNFIQHRALKKKVIENTEIINNSKIVKKKPSKKLLQKQSKNGKTKYYLDITKSRIENISIASLQDYVTHLAKTTFASKELPSHLKLKEIKTFIEAKNEKDLEKIKKNINDLNEKQNNGVFFSDIKLASKILIWQE